MAIQDFTAGQVLTAAQMDNLQANDYNQTVSTKTASYTLVAADKGTRVVMNSASATTITVNTSLFSAGDTLYLQNIGAGVCTVTAGTATVSSAGPLAIPQYGSGTLYFTSAGVSIFFPSAGPAASSGLTFITRQTFSATVTFSLTNVFSSSYNNYLIQVTGLFNTVNGSSVGWRLGTSGSAYTGNDYSFAGNFVSNGSHGVSQSLSGDNFQGISSYLSTSASFPSTINTFLFNPNTTSRTTMVSQILGNNDSNQLRNGQIFGTLNTATQYTDLFYFNTDSNNTSGTVTVYGLANS